nr:transmembrane protease serine 9-like [Aedes albopictus]
MIVIHSEAVCAATTMITAATSLVLIVLELSLFGSNQATVDIVGVQCGVQPIGPDELAEKEIDALPGEWPWHAAIYQIGSNGTQYVCGGTMIDERFIVTAAQCVCDRDRGVKLSNEAVLVRLGVLNLGASVQLMSQQYSVEEIIVHPKFTLGDYRADIAVLKLSLVVRFSYYVHPICVDQEGELRESPGTFVGWGSANVTSDLNDVQLPIHSGSACPSNDEGSFCGGSANFTYVCSGDIGGGIYTNKTTWNLVGILTLGDKNVDNEECRIDGYATFIKVNSYIPWIEKVTKLELVEKNDDYKFVIPNGVPAKKCAVKEIESTNSSFNHLPQDCGRYAVNRVLHGQKTELFEFPWMAIVRYLVAPIHELENLCVGSLISNRYVLTAAHCVKESKKPYQVRLGEHTMDQEEDCRLDDDRECAPPVRDYNIECIVQHRGYNKRLQKNNIALIRLDQDVTFEDHIQPICLPTSPHLKALQLPRYIVTGWGDTDDGDKSMTLLKTMLPQANRSECQAWMSLRGLQLTEEQLCVGETDGADTCKGDGGAPLGYSAKYNRGMHFVQFGIVSFGSGCGVVPSVYTRVASYMDWITANMQP